MAKRKALAPAHPADRFGELCQRIDKAKGQPVAEDLELLRTMFRESPDLWRKLGDMSRQAELKLIDSLGAPASSGQAMRYALDTLRHDLGCESAPPLERLLIEQVATSWLRLQVLEVKHVLCTTDHATVPQADFWDRTLSAAQRRHLRAVETLARVRHLLRPGTVQVNIGAQQVNVAGGMTAGKLESQ